MIDDSGNLCYYYHDQHIPAIKAVHPEESSAFKMAPVGPQLSRHLEGNVAMFHMFCPLFIQEGHIEITDLLFQGRATQQHTQSQMRQFTQ